MTTALDDGRPWPSPPRPPLARPAKLRAVLVEDVVRPVGAFGLRFGPGLAVEVHADARPLHQGDDGDGEPVERVRLAFSPRCAAELHRDLGRALEELYVRGGRPT